MKTKNDPHGNPNNIAKMSLGEVSDYLLDSYFMEMSSLIDSLHMELSEYTPKTLDAFNHLRSNATKIFRIFIDDVKVLITEAKSMDKSPYVQGKLFDDSEY